MRDVMPCVLSCLAGLAAGNWVSPGLNKCMDIARGIGADGDRENLDDLQAKINKDEAAGVQLYTCHGDFNQHYRLEGSLFKSHTLKNACLECAEDKKNKGYGTVSFKKCATNNKGQQWTLSKWGTLKCKLEDDQGDDAKLCLDALPKGKYWIDVKAHELATLSMGPCLADTKSTAGPTTDNQLWAWRPFKDGKFVTEKFSLSNDEFTAIAPASLALTVVAISLLVVAAAIGIHRARRVDALRVPLEPTE